jgi:hypothetical protein
MKKSKGKVVGTHDEDEAEESIKKAAAASVVVEEDEEQQQVQSPLRVLIVGALLLSIGTLAFYNIPGMIKKDVGGNHLVNSFYCAAITLAT